MSRRRVPRLLGGKEMGQGQVMLGEGGTQVPEGAAVAVRVLERAP
jgi:hypothetical protein